MDLTKKPIYPIDSWNIRETGFTTEYNYRNETTFALSNGYIGTRGTFEEAYEFDIDTGLEGNFINGFYESEKIRYGEANFGSPEYSQSLLNLPNLKEIRLEIEGERFDMRQGILEDYCRSLNMKEGVLERSLTWISPKGHIAAIRIRRLVSFHCKNLMETSYEVTPLNFSGHIRFISRLQADVENHTRKTNPIVDYGPFGRRLTPVMLETDGDGIYYQGITNISRLVMACGCRHKVVLAGEADRAVAGEADKAVAGAGDRTAAGGADRATAGTADRAIAGAADRATAGVAEQAPPRQASFTVTAQAGELDASVIFDIPAIAGQTVTLEKYMVYTSALDMPEESLKDFTQKLLADAYERGYSGEAALQKEYMEQFWEASDVRIEGDEALLQGIRFNLFHIMQAAGRDGRTGMGAKGLTGEGYEGHYFWDTEMYMLPVFIYTRPELARKLLDFRYNTLDQARKRARVLGHEKGALYPWRTINGEEASTYYPLGTAQYHINGDIAYALCLYMNVTGDVEYLKEKGAEILIETARVWADVGSFAQCRDGKYCICSVTGPDEYNVLVDNNFYTNLMARENLRAALKAVEYLESSAPGVFAALSEKLNFNKKETLLWAKIVDRMYFPYDETRGIYPLDDGFMMRKPWDESRIPPEKRAWLYENYHPLFIMRHRMSKQADSILGMYLYGNLFTDEEVRRNYDFYQEVTLHHSSLSTCIFGIVASRIGYHEEAYRYFSQSARMDLDDYHNNVYAGIHGANMAGTWQAIINGFAGLYTDSDGLHFKPWLPESWKGYSFRITYRGRLLNVEIRPGEAVYTLLKGHGLSLHSGARHIFLEKEGECCHETI